MRRLKLRKRSACVLAVIAVSLAISVSMRREVAVEVYLWTLKNGSYDAQLNAVVKLAKLRTSRSISETCILFENSPSDSVYRSALIELGTDAVPCLVRNLMSDNEDNRIAAASLLRSLGSDANDATSALGYALFDKSDLVRYWAAYAFRYIDSIGPGAVDRLKDLAEHDNNSDVRLIAEQVVQERGL